MSTIDAKTGLKITGRQAPNCTIEPINVTKDKGDLTLKLDMVHGCSVEICLGNDDYDLQAAIPEPVLTGDGVVCSSPRLQNREGISNSVSVEFHNFVVIITLLEA